MCAHSSDLTLRENHWVASQNVKSFFWLPEHQAFLGGKEEKKGRSGREGEKNLLSPIATQEGLILRLTEVCCT